MNDDITIEHDEEILIDDAYLKALLEEINKASSSIDMEVYIFDNDAVGQLVADTLCNAAKRGVKIRLLVDGIGSIDWGGNITKQMESHGIKTKVFHPLPWKISHWNRSIIVSKFIIPKIITLLSKVNSRNHRKACIIDKNIVFVGSANITSCLTNNNSFGKCWRETSVKLIGANISELQYAFDRTWGKIPFKQRLYKSFDKNTVTSIFQLNYSWRLRHQYYKTLLNRIHQCNERIWVTNAYFVPNSRLLKALINASCRGVDVKILLPDKSDIAIVSMVASAFYSTLLKNGITVYEYTPAILHAKVLILDNWYSVGSSNLNYRSFKHDLELDVNIKTDKAKKILDKQFLHDLSQSHQLKLADVNNQTIFKKIIAHFILLIKYWL